MGVPDWPAVIQLLQMHIQTAHPAARPQEGGAGGGAASRGKLDKKPRPEANPNMSEHEFKFFQK